MKVRFKKATLSRDRGGYYPAGSIQNFSDAIAAEYYDRGLADPVADSSPSDQKIIRPGDAEGFDPTMPDLTGVEGDPNPEPEEAAGPQGPRYEMGYGGMDMEPQNVDVGSSGEDPSESYRGLESRIVAVLQGAGVAPDVLSDMSDEDLIAIDGIAQASADRIRAKFPYSEDA